ERNVADIGTRIRSIRQQRGLKVKQLAEAAGITSSLLSQVERGLSNPSINTLRAIAQALDVPIVVFFEQHDRSDDLVVRRDARAKLRLPNSEVEYELLSPAGSSVLQLFLMHLEPKSASLNAPMSHHGEEAALVQEGRVELELGSRLVTLHAGDSVLIPSGTLHRWHNPQPQPATIVFAISPPSF
ncbi:XRE family transcriptional regulator, partial [Aquisalimonas sp.]|uniref:helix-turn-helix domain-containing protein n=1 Tax=Aquisalimonas sp. TaxID=1872621 RepID=UPI0025BDB1D2